jgi:leucyl aminopeptidase (aminopeptidase T)
VLLVTNPDEEVARIALALHDAAAAAGAVPAVVVQAVKGQLDFADDAVIAAIATGPEIVVSISANKIGKDREAIAKPRVAAGKRYDSTFHWLLGTRKSRGFWSPGTTRAMFARTVPIDYRLLKSRAAALKAALDEAVSVRITSPGGTDLTIGLEGRVSFVDDGDLAAPGAGGNLPAGEAFVSPALGTAEGVLVFDGSVATAEGTLLLSRPVRAEVRGGFVAAIAGGAEAATLLESIEAAEALAARMEAEGRLPAGQGDVYRRNARNLGELGIGLNPAALITGNMLEDEKVSRTCHVAIGSNYDEDAPALIHLDGLVHAPTIVARLPGGSTRVLLEDGELRAPRALRAPRVPRE